MRELLIAASLLSLAGAAPALSQQTGGAVGTMTPADVGAGPMTGTPSANYAAWAADSDLYELQSSKLALSKSKSDAVRTFAENMIADHTKTTQALMAALPKTEPRVPRPPKRLSEMNAAKIKQLRDASEDAFDSLYLQQQLQAHQMAWSLHSGYATDGADPALRQVATAAVPIIEKHLQHLKGMPAAGSR